MRNDCWIDSAYYAMFAAPNLRPIFTKVLDIANSSQEPALNNFAKYSFNYLFGLEDPNWAQNCKALCKENIGKSIINYANALLKKGDTRLETFIYAANAGLFINAGGNGNSSYIFQFISSFAPNVYYDTQSTNSFNTGCTTNRTSGSKRKPILNFINNRMKAIGEISSDVLIIPLTSIDTYSCQNVTRLTEIKQRGIWSLEAIIKGSDVHYTADVKCGDKWYMYNDQGISTTKSLLDDSWTNQDSVLFIYKKQIKSGGKRTRCHKNRRNLTRKL